MYTDKKDLRQFIRNEKKKYTEEELKEMSQPVLSLLEDHAFFNEAQTIMAYYSLPDEVYTHAFLEKWVSDKKILLPVVVGEDLFLKEYISGQDMRSGDLHVLEPDSDNFFELYEKIDLIIVPGVAFDQRGMRMGRGKGFYDRFLPKVPHAHKLGICFPFQIVEKIPADPWDIPMDAVLPCCLL